MRSQTSIIWILELYFHLKLILDRVSNRRKIRDNSTFLLHVSLLHLCIVKKKVSLKNKKTLKQFVGLFQESEKCQQSHASVSSWQYSYANDSATKSKTIWKFNLEQSKNWLIHRAREARRTQGNRPNNYAVWENCIRFKVYIQAAC